MDPQVYTVVYWGLVLMVFLGMFAAILSWDRRRRAGRPAEQEDQRCENERRNHNSGGSRTKHGPIVNYNYWQAGAQPQAEAPRNNKKKKKRGHIYNIHGAPPPGWYEQSQPPAREERPEPRRTVRDRVVEVEYEDNVTRRREEPVNDELPQRECIGCHIMFTPAQRRFNRCPDCQRRFVRGEQPQPVINRPTKPAPVVTDDTETEESSEAKAEEPIPTGGIRHGGGRRGVVDPDA